MNGGVAFDLATPCDVFRHVRTADGSRPYDVRVCGEAEEVSTDRFGIRAPHRLDELENANTIVVPGIDDHNMAIPLKVLDALRQAWVNGARVTSICTGSFVLAEAGLLDDLTATTHWIGVSDFRRRFPAVKLDEDVLYVDEGRIVTSAGLSSGLDMCLHLVRRDHGQAVAAQSARLAVAPLDRDGGQSQYILREPPGSSASLAPFLDWMLEHVGKQLTVNSLAARAGMTPRTFARRFRDQTGTTPVQWLLTARVRRAQELLETTTVPIDAVAYEAGFDAPITFRARFKRIVGMTPGAYRKQFNPSAVEQ